MDNNEFEIEYFVPRWQDKLTTAIRSPTGLRVRIDGWNGAVRRRVDSRVSSVNLEFVSNCCMVFQFGFGPMQRRFTRKELDDLNILLFHDNQKIIEVRTLDDVEEGFERKELVFRPRPPDKIVRFSLTDDVDASEDRIFVRAGYLDYEFDETDKL